MNDNDEERPTGAGVIIRRTSRLARVLPSAKVAVSLHDEFRTLRSRLPGASPEMRSELLCRLDEIVRRQNVLRDHAQFFLPDRMPKRGDTLH